MSRRKRRTFARRRSGAQRRPDAGSARGPAPQRRLRLREPGDLVVIVPYLLGFEPADSIVTILVRRGQIQVTARLDLPALESVDELSRYLLDLVDAQKSDQILLLTYSSRGEPARVIGERLTARLAPHGLTESLFIEDGRWWSLSCTQDCCPADGTPYDPSSHPLAAEAVYAGLSVLPGRESLAALVAGPPDSDVDDLVDLSDSELAGLPASRGARQELVDRLVGEYLTEPHELTDEECCRLAVLVSDLEVRDVAWASMSRERAHDQVELWRRVVARTVPPLAPAPVCLLGMAAWISGNGALLNVCIDKMAGLDPSYTMAGILADISDRALPPSLWAAIRPEFGNRIGLLAG